VIGFRALAIGPFLAVVAYLAAFNPLAMQASRCMGTAVYKDDQCDGDAWTWALEHRGWKSTLRHPEWVLEAHATAAQVLAYRVKALVR